MGVAFPLPAASALRRQIAMRERHPVDHVAGARRRAAAAEAAAWLAQDILTEAEREAILDKLWIAVERGEYEMTVLRFPSDLCSDGGRAVNNCLDGWPDTLPGKARAIYAMWLHEARPSGYRLKCAIVDFPNGIPGDVGLALNWSK